MLIKCKLLTGKHDASKTPIILDGYVNPEHVVMFADAKDGTTGVTMANGATVIVKGKADTFRKKWLEAMEEVEDDDDDEEDDDYED